MVMTTKLSMLLSSTEIVSWWMTHLKRIEVTQKVIVWETKDFGFIYGVIDSLKILIINWNEFQAQKQFRDILHSHLHSEHIS